MKTGANPIDLAFKLITLSASLSLFAYASEAARAPLLKPAGLETLAAGPTPSLAAPVMLDDFEDVSGWSAHPADAVELAIRSDAGFHGHSLRLDVHFLKGSGYAVARKVFSFDLPSNYRFRFHIRGQIPPNNLEFKLIDSTGENVWWSNRRDYHFPQAWDSLTTRKRQIPFAWGPLGGGEIHHVAAIEFAVTAGSGGVGTVWLDDLMLETLPAEGTAAPPPSAEASSSRPGHGPEQAIDGDSTTTWQSGTADLHPSLTLDLGIEREFGGLLLDWESGRQPSDYVIEASPDDQSWRMVRIVRDSNGGRDYLYLPESESRWLRIRSRGKSPAKGLALREVTIEPLEWSSSIATFFQAMARDARVGDYPRAMRGEQCYWTVIGDDSGDSGEGLLSEDGALETGKASFSVEPFLYSGGRLLTWNEARKEQRLEDGSLPMPSVQWTLDDLSLNVTAFATTGSKGAHALAAPTAGGARNFLVARYRVKNRGKRPLHATLYLALRPFQVNPPTQTLNTPGGVAEVREIKRDGSVVRVNGDRGIVSLARPTGFGAATFDQGDVVEFLRRGRLPLHAEVIDPFGHASGALAYALELVPGAEREVDVLVPLRRTPMASTPETTPAAVAKAQAETHLQWLSHRRGIAIDLPDSARELVTTLWAQLGYILINRDGAAIQPGSRSYERSWIRDGSLTSSALLRLGHPEVVRDFINWYAKYQYANGKIPCCIDQRGPDPVPEHDSSGEFIFLIAQYYRYTTDRTLVERQWPAVSRAVAYLDSLRQQRRTSEWRAPGKEPFFGLLPPSISHEGYSAKPMHSYWDDLFALKGFRDAVYLAGVLGHDDERARFATIRDEFQHDLSASIEAAMAAHRIEYVPGCADLGDFDPTSTTIALSPVEAETLIPRRALERTFERYWAFFHDRRADTSRWEAFTPYEIRNVGAFVRLGWRERAQELLDFFLAYRRPAGWAQWAEVVWHDPRAAKFIGDMPHTWVGSDYVRSVLDLFAYERGDSALVVGGGVPLAWVTRNPGVSVRGLPTPYGKLSYSMRPSGNRIAIMIEEGIQAPPGGIVIRAPGVKASWSATVNGSRVPVSAAAEVMVRSVPATILLAP